MEISITSGKSTLGKIRRALLSPAGDSCDGSKGDVRWPKLRRVWLQVSCCDGVGYFAAMVRTPAVQAIFPCAPQVNVSGTAPGLRTGSPAAETFVVLRMP